MIKRLATAWSQAVRADDSARLKTIWSQLAVTLHESGLDWIVRRRHRLELRLADSVPRFCRTLLTNGRLRTRGADEIWRLIAVAALRREEADNATINTEDALASCLVHRCRSLIDELADAELERVALLVLGGIDNREIADCMQYTPRTLQRKLQLIRRIWSNHADE